ncbi:hypothetical protein [Nonomuraea soli]|uniref:Cytochrome bc1 complex cytochrome b subunit n=1 Tax=Nonomuraea soli TaxID=1032476 RepID=A0A7W0HUS8_9ACTN|nr:hypothetical protein [Nonomuraea soli]MBA2896514.1 quinol-cytochrome oxidoreductase complex cytochrome b subunit [Nonomuraea soli]
MDRARQLLGDMLIYCFAVVLATGAFLAFFYVPSGREVVYDGLYTPLHGVMMSEAYASTLTIGFEVRGGLLIRQLHHSSSLLLLAGTAIWGLLGRFGRAFAALGACLLAVLGGYGTADDTLYGLPVAIVVWYGLHLAAALAVIVMLVQAARHESALRPRGPGFVLLGLVLSFLALWPFW